MNEQQPIAEPKEHRMLVMGAVTWHWLNPPDDISIYSEALPAPLPSAT